MKFFTVMVVGYSLIRNGNNVELDLRTRMTTATGYSKEQVEQQAERVFASELRGCEETLIVAREITPDEIEEVYRLA